MLIKYIGMCACMVTNLGRGWINHFEQLNNSVSINQKSLLPNLNRFTTLGNLCGTLCKNIKTHKDKKCLLLQRTQQ